MHSHSFLPFLFLLGITALGAEPKPVPRMQAIPLPREEVSFQRDGEEIARFRFAQDQRRPFIFPILGPSGRSLTRMASTRFGHAQSSQLGVVLAPVCRWGEFLG
jgi:Methane oxygenase PmoA